MAFSFSNRIANRFSSYYCCSLLLLLFAAPFRPVSAQCSFSIESTSYDCAKNLICLGEAHVYAGNASNQIQSGSLSLTSENHTIGDQDGIAYYREPVRFIDPSTRQSASFNTSFEINLALEFYYEYFGVREVEAGDGMAFVISADNSTRGASGQNLGFFNANGTTSFKSIVVEFDSFQNSYAPVYDISNNHVSFDFSNITFAAAANSPVPFWYNNTIYAWVEYSSSTKELEVRVSDENSRPISPLLNYIVNLCDVVEEYMWVGFSSGNGAVWSNFYIGNWSFESSGIPA